MSSSRDHAPTTGAATPKSAAPRRRIGWYSIATAPKDGTRVIGRRSYADRYTGVLRYEKHLTFWGKTSHVPIYGWNYGRDVEDLNLWQPMHWRPVE